MKYILWIIFIAIVVGGGYMVYQTSQNSMVSSDVATTTTAVATSTDMTTATTTTAKLTDGTYALNAQGTKAAWEGRKTVLVNWVDRGNITISAADATVAGGVVTKGRVVFDMNSIAPLSTGSGSGMDRLATHLKSDDFFNAAQYPQVVFNLNRVEAGAESGQFVAKGSLTIRDVTKPIDIPVTIKQVGTGLEVAGKATVDRTIYGVKFGSTKFFSDLGDNIVSDTFVLDFTLALKAK